MRSGANWVLTFSSASGKISDEAAADAAGAHLSDLGLRRLSGTRRQRRSHRTRFSIRDELFARVGLGYELFMSVVLPAPRKAHNMSILVMYCASF